MEPAVSEIDHRTIAIERYNHCWDLLERDERSPDEDVELWTVGVHVSVSLVLCGRT